MVSCIVSVTTNLSNVYSYRIRMFALLLLPLATFLNVSAVSDQEQSDADLRLLYTRRGKFLNCATTRGGHLSR